MANLNAWQKITRVLSGKPFGDGADGAYSSATIPTMKYKTCSGTATSTTLTADTDASPFSVGDVLLLHQTRGTGVGQWEINRVSSVGSDQYTLQEALQYTYTDSGASQAQAVVIPRYTNVTVQAGTWTLTSWNEDIGGILTFAANGTVTCTGTIAGSGIAGADGANPGAYPQAGVGGAGRGFRGGNGYSVNGSTTAWNGEGTVAARSQSTSANGNGGGGAYSNTTNHNNGGGGGNGVAGSAAQNSDSGTNPSGGSTAGAADLITMVFGGGGGGGSGCLDGSPGGGGGGGGMVFISAKAITIAGAITETGGAGANGNGSCGGGGGGGSVLIQAGTATLGSNLITAVGGDGGGTARGGDGGAGRIAVHHSGAVTGTTNPTFDDTTDSSLVEAVVGGAFLFNMV